MIEGTNQLFFNEDTQQLIMEYMRTLFLTTSNESTSGVKQNALFPNTFLSNSFQVTETFFLDFSVIKLRISINY
jgi:hypothetical protein